jgi:precorrin-3B methylase
MARIGVGGVPEMKDMSLKDICAMISVEGLKVYVHTFRSEETAEDWYETVYFNEEPQKATESVKENADGNGVVVKGRGACFIGGLPVKRN